jgi:heme exporter protein D
MNWESVEQFLAMGGYAFYVWGSYFATVLFLTIEVISLILRKRTVLKRVGRRRGAPLHAESPTLNPESPTPQG